MKNAPSKVNKMLTTLAKDRDEEYRLFYFYEFPLEEFRNNSLQIVRENRFYVSAAEAESVEEEYKRLFPPLEVGTQRLHVEIETREKRERHTLIKGSIVGKEIQLWLPTQSFIYWRPPISEFIQDIFERYGQKPLYIRFSSRRSTFVPPFTYHGIFTEKTFELALRNAFYVADTFRSELKQHEY